MRNGAISTALFGLACVVAAGLSAQILGPGMWGAIILATGVFVAASPYVEPIRGAARILGLIAAILALLVVVLGVLAATTGGSFRLPDDQAMLLAVIACIGIFGIAVHKTLQSPQGP